MVVKRRISPTDKVHIMWFFVHKSLGSGWKMCPAKTYGMPCPACERRQKIWAMDRDEEALKKLSAPYYVGRYAMGLYNVVVHGDIQRGITWQEPVQYWDINNNFMESVLQGMAKSSGMLEQTGYVNYYYPTAGKQGGRHISVNIYKKGQYADYKSHAFYERRGPIPGSIMSQARCLGDFLYIGQANKERRLNGQEGPPTKEEFAQYYEELAAAVDVVAEAQQQGEAGVGQPTGDGYAVGGPPPSPGPSPVMGMGPELPFAQCHPLGAHYEEYVDCGECRIRIECGQAAPSSAPMPPAPVPQPVAVPQPAPAPGPVHEPEVVDQTTGPQPAPASPAPSPVPVQPQPAPAPASQPKPIPRRPQQ
jgi:hypothetical protein